MNLKWISLVTLVLQNSSLVLVMRYSRTLSSSYLASTAVVCAELIKLTLSLGLYWTEETSKKGASMSLKRLWSDVFGPDSQWKYMTVPAILYFVQNNLQYHAVSMVIRSVSPLAGRCYLSSHVSTQDSHHRALFCTAPQPIALAAQMDLSSSFNRRNRSSTSLKR